MKELTKEKQLKIVGGAVSATLWNAINKSVTLILELGRTLGSSIRRLTEGNLCKY